MAIALMILGTIFAAFCVRLLVRIINRDRGAIDLAIVLALAFGPVVVTLASILMGALIHNFLLR